MERSKLLYNLRSELANVNSTEISKQKLLLKASNANAISSVVFFITGQTGKRQAEVSLGSFFLLGILLST